MESHDEGYATQLSKLAALREQFEIRADSLPADVALAGLVDDLLDASSACIEWAERSTRVCYPLVRTAFEAAQRIVALATDDDYLRVGTRAWLYYQHKDASVRRKTDPEKADRWLAEVVSRMHDIWRPHNENAEELFADASACLKDAAKKRPRPPDNFMSRDLADVVQERYAKIFGPGSDSDIKHLNRGIYAALSLDSHARLRSEPASLTILPGGTVQIVPRRVDETARRRSLLNCLETSVTEAVGAVSYLLETRRQADAKRLRSVADRAIAEGLKPGFYPDLGLRLARLGGAGTAFHFLNVPIWKLGVLPDGSASWSANIVLADREYIATFDVPAILRRDLARCIGIPPAKLAPEQGIVVHNLDGPPTVRLECVLGELQRNDREPFVPLVVRRLRACARDETYIDLRPMAIRSDHKAPRG
jgi:hypothetical protein